ncbi:hypothetical protein [Labedaea rhizosphaerae]|uniref:DUF4157 domain-containing protein n=1 Tax=Labedaea rhizosphaerae TaxID=598644 RepID=A0A4R6RSY1_LABRH|nr:hypothetical protein [Labedaea rhizosphaerae]TDP89999.1 hypothetical protein EV186_111125 [Labedaea rhizosphaerae]
MNDTARAQVAGWQNIVDATHSRLQDAGQWPPVERGLTEQEKAAARAIFGNSLNLDAIQVNDDSFLGAVKEDNAISTPGVINFPPGTLSKNDPRYLPWLMHELTHQWQYQHGYRLDQLAVAAAAGNYDYGGDDGLRAATAQGKGIESFNFEQQGDIVRNYYLRKTQGGNTSAFDPFIQQIQANGPDLQAPPDWPPP